MRKKISELEESKHYTVSFDIYDTFNNKKIKIQEIKVLIKLENSMKILFIEENTISWYPSTMFITIFDEIPIKYMRKNKLTKLDNIKDE
jgi:hypothetical protein